MSHPSRASSPLQRSQKIFDAPQHPTDSLPIQANAERFQQNLCDQTLTVFSDDPIVSKCSHSALVDPLSLLESKYCANLDKMNIPQAKRRQFLADILSLIHHGFDLYFEKTTHKIEDREYEPEDKNHHRRP